MQANEANRPLEPSRPAPVLAIAALLAAASAMADTVYVNCAAPAAGQYSSITDAINSVPEPTPVTVLLESDCTESVTIRRPHVTIAPEGASCPWQACNPTSHLVQIAARNPGASVVTVSGSQDVTLIHLVLSGGSRGLVLSGNASVDAYGVIAKDNTSNGIDVGDNSFLSMREGGSRDNGGWGISISLGASVSLTGQESSLQNTELFVSGNDKGGIYLDRAHLSISGGTVIENNLGRGTVSFGGVFNLGAWDDRRALVRGNAGGIVLSEGSQASLWRHATIAGNGPFGVHVEGSSHATFYQETVLVEGHSEVGVSVTQGSQASFHGAKVRNNGSAEEPSSAGVRVDGHSQVTFDNGEREEPSEVCGNLGPGVVVDMGSGLDASEAVFRDNVKEGVRVRHLSVGYLGPEAVVFPNGGGALTCDSSSRVITNLVRNGPGCQNVEKATEPRPPRPAPMGP